MKIKLSTLFKQLKVTSTSAQFDTLYLIFCTSTKLRISFSKPIQNMLYDCISQTFVCCLQSILFGSRARVHLLEVCSPTLSGFPQRSVLSSLLLFLFYINVLTTLLSNDSFIALFTDDVSIITTASSTQHAQAAA